MKDGNDLFFNLELLFAFQLIARLALALQQLFIILTPYFSPKINSPA
jgi:hypothetical protein